jgi:superfamily II RNA helicase
LLNLYNEFGSRLLDIYPRSFHFFQSNRKGRLKGVAAIERKLGLLKHMGYLNEETLTQKGEFASWMYGYELLLSEMLDEGYLETLDMVKLSVLLCALVFEPRKNQNYKELSPAMASVEKKAMYYARKIQAVELEHKVYPQIKSPHFHLTEALEAWIGGAGFQVLHRHTDVDEGEIIRYFRMVIQLLRQIKQAPQVSPRLRQTAGEAVERINRDLVDAEKQLRNII